MNYLRVLKKSVKTIWKNKFLFVFGFFVVLSSIYSNFVFDFKNKSEFDAFILKAKDFISAYPQRAIALVVITVIIFVVLLFFKVVGVIGLIKCANNIDAGRDNVNFRLGFKTGIKKFWKMLGLKFTLAFSVLSAVIMLSIPCVFLFVNQLYVPGVIVSLFALVVVIPFLAVVFFTRIYGERYLIVDGEGIFKSIKMGANLFLENVKASLMMALILFLVNLAGIIAIFFGVFLLFIPFLVVGFILSILFTGLGLVLVVIGVLPALFVAAMIISVVLAAFKSAAWTLTFRQIR